MAACCIVVRLELGQLPFQVTGIPKQHVVEKLPPHRSDQALHEWVGQWHVRHGLDFIDFQNPKIRYPAVSLEHGIVIGAEMSGDTLPLNGGVEHAADVSAGDSAAMHA